MEPRRGRHPAVARQEERALRRASRSLCVASLLATAACARAEPESEPVRIAAASDLADVLPELVARFEERTGREVTVVYGATGVLARQIDEGAPFDVFAAAHSSFPRELGARGRCVGASERAFARGRLALVRSRGAHLPPLSLEALLLPSVARIALANPEVAPYGRAAREALVSRGIYGAVEKKLVPAENVRAALALLTSGNVDAALVAAPLVARGAQSERLEAVLIDSELHGALDQTVIACSERPEAGAIVELFASDEARAVFAAHGFEAPPGEPASRRKKAH